MSEENILPRICLNMIVKNESKIIQRLLDSVVDCIDTYCICDTGSTDNTVELIQTYFQQKKIPGIVIHEAFQDFGYNRSFALNACNAIMAEYILLLDADMVFWKNPGNSLKSLLKDTNKDAYYIYQGSDTYYYKNIRIVRNNIGFKYWGVTHEYVQHPPNTSIYQFEKVSVFIKDIGDGGAKTDKFLRDIRLLEKGLEELPNNDRYLFYLANSYKDAGQYEKAIENYQKRIAVGGWIEEVWHSYYSMGKCWKSLGNMNNAIISWMNGYQAYPNRIENLFEMIEHYRYEGKNQLSYLFYTIADRMRIEHPERSYLFMQKDIYDYRLDYELSIFGYYVNLDNHDLKLVSMKVLSNPFVTNNTITNVFSNYKFYTEKAVDFDTKWWTKNKLGDVLKQVGKSVLRENPDFVSSTPSFVFTPDNKLVVNVRLVNYKITENGDYENPGTIHTINIIAIVRWVYPLEEWVIEKETILDYDKSMDNRYIGLEDIRLLFVGDKYNYKIYYSANRGLDDYMVVEMGEIDKYEIVTTNDVFLEIEGQKKIEKNWVFFPSSIKSEFIEVLDDDNIPNEKFWKSKCTPLKMIYNWNPIISGEIVDDVFFKEIARDTSVPPFFKHIRGSCNGIYMSDINETWFLCHIVSYENRRYYYHILVALDADTGRLKRYTRLFTLEKEKVEYVLGFERIPLEREEGETEQFLLGYSILDKETKYMTLSRQWFEDRFCKEYNL
jgi:tetratricopeptide (TPR) repeat protein